MCRRGGLRPLSMLIYGQVAPFSTTLLAWSRARVPFAQRPPAPPETEILLKDPAQGVCHRTGRRNEKKKQHVILPFAHCHWNNSPDGSLTRKSGNRQLFAISAVP